MIYNIIFGLMPEKYKKWVKDYLRYAAFAIPPEKFGGFAFLYGLFLGIVVFSVLLLLFSVKIAILVGVSTIIVFEAIFHSVLILVSDGRAKFTEEVLPDALRLMSSNIKSGLTPDKALMLSARPEFGPLEKEIRRAAKMTVSGEPTEEAILSISDRIDSKALRRSMDLLSEGMRKGGNLAHLLDGLADDIRQTKILRREVKAYVMMYVIFIFFAAGIGAPMLYAISSYLVQTMTEIGGAIDVGETAGMQGTFTGGMRFLSFSGVELSQGFLRIYSLLSIAVTSFFGGLLIGLVQEGSERAGIKYIPILLIISVSVYFLSSILVVRVLGSIMI